MASSVPRDHCYPGSTGQRCGTNCPASLLGLSPPGPPPPRLVCHFSGLVPFSGPDMSWTTMYFRVSKFNSAVTFFGGSWVLRPAFQAEPLLPPFPSRFPGRGGVLGAAPPTLFIWPLKPRPRHPSAGPSFAFFLDRGSAMRSHSFLAKIFSLCVSGQGQGGKNGNILEKSASLSSV